MLGANTDVSTMNLIVDKYRIWRAQNPQGELQAFVVGFINKRYETTVQSSKKNGVQKRMVTRALVPYTRELNHDGDFSLLALLGAVSEAESFAVKPGRIMKKIYRNNQDIPSYIFGGYGISDLEAAFRIAGQEFNKGA